MAELYQIRSGFTDEIISADVQPKTHKHIEKKNGYIRSNYIKVLCDENELGKHKRDYVSIECHDLDDHAIRENMIDVTQEGLQHMGDNMHVMLKKILMVGLENRLITSGVLGPQTASEVLAITHLYEHEDPARLKETCNVTVLQPGVMGQTGLESLSVVQSVVRSYQPDLAIVIDALTTHNIARTNHVAQINNTGTRPGSDAGNYRMSFCEKGLHVPVTAIDVATVTNIGVILHKTLEVSGEGRQHILQKIQDSGYLNLVVTPKSTDNELKHLVYIVLKSLNRSLRPNYERLQRRILSPIV